MFCPMQVIVYLSKYYLASSGLKEIWKKMKWRNVQVTKKYSKILKNISILTLCSTIFKKEKNSEKSIQFLTWRNYLENPNFCHLCISSFQKKIPIFFIPRSLLSKNGTCNVGSKVEISPIFTSKIINTNGTLLY